ncbi:hypothetical protein JCM3765_000704 [Sporobolomyces pararoseus]
MGKSRSSKSYSPRVVSTTERKKKVPFTDQDWERLIKMLAKAKEREWNKGRIYQELEEKYPDHTRQSWQTYHSKSREHADEALKIYLKNLRKHNETVETTCDEGEEEVEEPPRKKKKKNHNNDVRETEKKKPSTTNSSNSTNKVIVDDDFDPPSPSPSKSPPPPPKRSQFRPQSLPLPPPSTSTSSTSSKPKPQPPPTHPTSKSSSKSLPPPPQTQQQQQQIIEISSSDENNSAQSPPSRHRHRHRRRPPPPPTAPPAPLPPIESFNPSFPTTSTSTTNSKVQKEEKQQQQHQQREKQLELAKTIPLPEPDENENENENQDQDYSILLEDGFKNDDDDDNDHDEPSTQEEEDDFKDRDLEKGKGTRKEQDPSPSSDEDEGEEEQEEEEEDSQDGDDELKDDQRLIWELTRIDWFDSTKQIGYENLSKLYPHYSSEEWEKLYKSKLSYFLPLISKSLEALEAEERDSKQEEEMEENYLLEELVRCELLGIEKNPQVWENLNKLYPRLNQMEWKELYNKTKRSVWQKRIGEKIKLTEEDRERRRRKKEGKEKKKKKKDKGKGIEREKIQKVVRETKENKRKVEEEGEVGIPSREIQRKKVDKGKGRAVNQDQGIQNEPAIVRGSDVISRPPSATAARPSSTQNRSNPTKALKSVAPDPNSSNNRSTSRFRDTLKPTPTPPPRGAPPVTVLSASEPTVTTTTQPQPVSSHRSPSPPSPPRRPRILSAQLEPPTPERQRSPHSVVPSPSSSPHRLKFVPPTTPDMPTPPPLLPPSSSSSTDETVLHWSQYSVLPSPLKQSSQSRLLNSSSDREDEDEDKERDQDEDEDEDVEMKEEREIELKIEVEKKEEKKTIIPSRTSTSEETTSSDKILLAKLERSVLEEEQEEAEEEVMEEDISEKEEDKLVEQQLLSQPQPQLLKYELNEDNQEEVQLPRHSVEESKAPGTTSDSEEEDEDGLNLSHPFEKFDPSEPIFAPLTSEEETIGLDHIKVLERWERRRSGGEETENEEGEGEENNLGASALQREAEEWARDDQKGRQTRGELQVEEVEADEAESEVGLEKFNREEEEKENDRIDKSIGGGGKKRRRSEVSGSLADVEQPPAKKPRQKSLQSTVSAVSSSMTPEDVENWRDRVQQEKVTSNILDQPRSPVFKSGSIAFEPRPLGSPRRTPRASIAASSPRTKVPELPSTSSRPSATALPPATHRSVDQTATKNVRKDLEKIAQDLDLDINFVDGLYFRCCAPSNLDLFRDIAKMYSPKLRPDPSTSEYQKLEKKIKLWLWDYEEDKILLEGTKEEKAQLEKKKSKKAVTRRLEFFKRSKKNKIEQLPPRYYPSLSHAK